MQYEQIYMKSFYALAFLLDIAIQLMSLTKSSRSTNMHRIVMAFITCIMFIDPNSTFSTLINGYSQSLAKP